MVRKFIYLDHKPIQSDISRLQPILSGSQTYLCHKPICHKPIYLDHNPICVPKLYLGCKQKAKMKSLQFGLNTLKGHSLSCLLQVFHTYGQWIFILTVTKPSYHPYIMYMYAMIYYLHCTLYLFMLFQLSLFI